MSKLLVRSDKTGRIVSAFGVQTEGAPSNITLALEPGDVMHEVDVPAELLERGLLPDFESACCPCRKNLAGLYSVSGKNKEPRRPSGDVGTRKPEMTMAVDTVFRVQR